MLLHDNKTLRYLVGFTAIVIALCSAAFSVYGLSLMFAGIAVIMMIMGSVIELGKVVAVAYLYQRWKTINWVFRGLMALMIVGAMAVTSTGIFGILSSGYEKAAVEMTSQSNEISLLNNKKTYFVSQIKNLETQKTFYEQRAIQLSTLRKNQEERLDKLTTDKRSSSSTDKLIKQSNIDIDSANKRVDGIMLKVNQLNDSIQSTDQKIQTVTLTNNNSSLDPLKYLSRTVNESADKFVKWFIILLIFIFDPFAIVLLMAFNQMNLDKNHKNEVVKEEKEPIFNKFKKFFKKKEKLIEPHIEEPINWVEPVEDEPKSMYDLFKNKLPEPLPEPIKPNVIQSEIPFEDWVEPEPIEDEKKTSVGNDLEEYSEENKLPVEILTSDVLVYHDFFGKGKILTTYPNKRIKVQFESGEIKELDPNFANLKTLSETEEDLKKSEIGNDLYVQEKIIDGKTILEITTNPVEHESELPYLTIKVDEPIVENIEEVIEPVIEDVTPVLENIEPVLVNIEEIPPVPFIYRHEENGIESVTIGTRVIRNDPEIDNRTQKIHFTKDRKGRID
jgi:hypothetical protein